VGRGGAFGAAPPPKRQSNAPLWYYIAYRIDAEKGEGPRLANQYRIRGIPKAKNSVVMWDIRMQKAF